jgi:ribonucleoside-triphosphate reductase (formate)
MRTLKTFPGMTVVGFPTVPLLLRLGLGERSVTAGEASPEDHYRWLRLLEQHWIGAEQGNQISYTLKIFTDRYDLEAFRTIVREQQPTVRCCAVLPSRPDHELGYEYLPEEEVSAAEFDTIVLGIGAGEAREAIDLVHLQCASGACPI